MPVIDQHGHDDGADPFVGQRDVIGLYPADRAAAASRWTVTLDGDDRPHDD